MAKKRVRGGRASGERGKAERGTGGREVGVGRGGVVGVVGGGGSGGHGRSGVGGCVCVCQVKGRGERGRGRGGVRRGLTLGLAARFESELERKCQHGAPRLAAHGGGLRDGLG